MRRACEHGRPEIHHSDQGVQYAATAYVEMLKSREVKISMANVGEPEENGYAERLMRTIKEEGERQDLLCLRLGLSRGDGDVVLR